MNRGWVGALLVLALVALAACARSDEEIERLADQRIRHRVGIDSHSLSHSDGHSSANFDPDDTAASTDGRRSRLPGPFPAEPTPQPTATPIVLPPPPDPSAHSDAAADTDPFAHGDTPTLAAAINASTHSDPGPHRHASAHRHTHPDSHPGVPPGHYPDSSPRLRDRPYPPCRGA